METGAIDSEALWRRVGLDELRQALRRAQGLAEQTQTELIANAPTPCRCSSGPCTCHDWPSGRARRGSRSRTK